MWFVMLLLGAGMMMLDVSAAADTGASDMSLGGMPLYSPQLQSRAISMENQTGAKGQGGQAQGGRKGSAAIYNLVKDEVRTVAEIEGPGCIRHIWFTIARRHDPLVLRNLIIRFYWDDQKIPSVEAPFGDFFGMSHGHGVAYECAFFAVPEARGFNCFFPMPFAKKARVEICNDVGEDIGAVFFQFDYTLGDKVDENTPYFHSQFRRTAVTKLREDFVILETKGKGRYMGANIGVIDRFNGIRQWWGEGEVKMYIDGDKDFPTICGTGAEDYVLSAWGLGVWQNQYSGSLLDSNTTKYMSMYRYHCLDPVYFHENIKVTIQQMGYDLLNGAIPEEGNPYYEFYKRGEWDRIKFSGLHERSDDVCATAYWYQLLPTNPFPPFPDRALRSLNIVEEKKEEQSPADEAKKAPKEEPKKVEPFKHPLEK